MKAIKKLGYFIIDLVEIYIPAFAFFSLFILTNVAIFYRYVLKSPLVWPYELTLMAFMWTIMLGGCYALRKKQHVVFPVVYDLLPPKAKAFLRIATNLVISIIFIMSIKPSINYFLRIQRRTTAALRIPLTYVYFPFVVFLLFTVAYSLYDLFKDLRAIFKGNFPLEEIERK